MAERVKVRPISSQEGNRLLRIVRRGAGSVVTWRRAQMILLSAQAMDVPQIARVTFGDPEGALAHAAAALAPGGVVMLVEPYAGDRVEDNLNPVGRLYYSASVAICLAHGHSEGHHALGAQAGEARLAEVCSRAGLTHVRRAAETPFNLVLEVRP